MRAVVVLVDRDEAVAWIGSWDAQQQEFMPGLLCGVLGTAAGGSAG